MIFTVRQPVYSYLMNHPLFTVILKAWVFMYGNILAYKSVREAYLAGKISWLNDRFLVEDDSWGSWEIPPSLQGDTEKNVEFWSYVKLFADLVMKSPVYSLSFGCPGSDKGFGLKCRKNTDSRVLSNEIFGLMESLNEEQMQNIDKKFKYKSMIMKNGNEKCIFFGPLSLANNDNNSQLQFLDRDYHTDQPLFMNLRVEHLMFNFNVRSSITSIARHRIARLHCNKVVIYLAGEDICAWYRDKDFVDMSNDTSSDEEDSVGGNDAGMKSMLITNKKTAYAPAAPRGQPTLASAFKRRRAKTPSTPLPPKKKRSESSGSSVTSSAVNNSSSGSDYASSTASTPVVMVKEEPRSFSTPPLNNIPDTSIDSSTTTPGGPAATTVAATPGSVAGTTPGALAGTPAGSAVTAATPKRSLIVPDTYADDDETQLEFTPVQVLRDNADRGTTRPTKPVNTPANPMTRGAFISRAKGVTFVDSNDACCNSEGIFYPGQYAVQSSQEQEDDNSSSSDDTDSTYEESDAEKQGK